MYDCIEAKNESKTSVCTYNLFLQIILKISINAYCQIHIISLMQYMHFNNVTKNKPYKIKYGR